MLCRISALLKLTVNIALALGLIDAAVFRSGLYAHWINFDSTAGSTIANVMAMRHYYDPGRKNILVLGNSQIGEGFSGPIADATVGGSNLHFINGAIAGTSPRVWNYVLREVDPDANRYAAIAMMVDYDATLWLWGAISADYSLDTSYVAPLLRLSDVFDYPASFLDTAQRERARRAILLPAQAMHDDLLDFLAHPDDRLRQIERTRPGWMAAVVNYPGRPEALPDLPIDPASGTPSNWGGEEASLKPKLEPYFSGLRSHNDAAARNANIEYERKWLSRIAARYQAEGVPVIVFSVPRGPWHSIAPMPQPNPALTDLDRDGSLLVLPGGAFVQFERPQFFFDTLHMNRAGREAFSALLAQKIAPLVH